MNEAIHITETLLRIQRQGLSASLATVIEATGSVPRQAGSRMIIWPDGSIEGTVGGGQMEARVIQDGLNTLETGKTALVEYNLTDIGAGDPGICGGTVRIFVEPLLAAPLLLVIGGGHVGKALAELGKWSGFRVALSDDRPEFCNEDYVAGLDMYLPVKPSELRDHLTIDQHTYVAAVTRGLPIDEKLIPALLETPAAYIGLIGSRRRWSLTMQALEQQGLARKQLERIHAPLGLELNAETPQEIAVSIMAEIIMLYRGGDGTPMRWMGI